jgi:hypothetical protein
MIALQTPSGAAPARCRSDRGTAGAPKKVATATNLLADRRYEPLDPAAPRMRLSGNGFRWIRLGGMYDPAKTDKVPPAITTTSNTHQSSC